MNSRLEIARAFDSGTAWAEWQGHFTAKGVRCTCAWKADSLSHGDIKLFSLDWKTKTQPFYTWPSFNPNGHNWPNVARIDFSLWPSFSPYRWSGHLLTSDYNVTFKVHRRAEFITAICRWNAKPISCTLHDFDGVPYWHAVFKNGKDVFAMNKSNEPRWGRIDWLTASSPEELARTFVTARLANAA